MRPLLPSLLALVVTVSSGRLLGSPTLELSRSATAVNTNGYEDSPFLSPDGLAFYFMYTPWTVWPTFFDQPAVLVGPARLAHHANPDANPWEDSDVYVSRRQPDGSWGTPINLGFNDAQADCCVMTWDHQRFYYQRTQFPNARHTDLYTTERVAGGTWSRRSLGESLNRVDSSEQNPHVTQDGRELWFTSDRPGGQGGTDLYLSRRAADESWSAPVGLPTSINTAADEDQAWLTADGQTLYFNREPGPRIMVSHRTADGWTTPAEVTFGGTHYDAAEVSGTADGQQLALAIVVPQLADIVMVTVLRNADGSWGSPAQIDHRPLRAPTRLRLSP